MMIQISILILTVQIFELVKSITIFDVIKNLTTDLELNLNIFLNDDEEISNELYLRNELTPKIILDYDTADIEIKGRESETLLTVAFVKESDTVRSLNLVVHILWELHFTDVVFVYKSTSEAQYLYLLFQLCWHHGFVNVLALVNQTPYTYHPFPYIEVVELHTLNEYYDKSHLENFQGYPLRGSISHNSPRVYHYTDAHGKLGAGGYIYALILSFIKHHNGTFQEVFMPTYSVNLYNSITAFQNKKIDIIPELLYMYSNYSHSNVVCIYRSYLMVPYANPLPNQFYILKPMTFLMWVLIIIIFCYAIGMQMFLSWLQVNKRYFGLALLRTMSSMLFIPCSYYRRSTRAQNCCSVILLVGCFLLTNFYQSNLSSMLIAHLYEPQVDTIAEIARTNYRIPQTKMDAIHLQSLSGVPQIVYDRLMDATPEEVHQWRRDLNTSFIHSGVEDEVKFFMYQQKFLRKPRFKVIEETLSQLPVFIALPHGSPFLHQLNRYIRYIFDTGIFYKMFSDSAEEGILNGEIEFYRTATHDFQPLTASHFSLVFGVWIFGMLCGSICFLIELKIFKKCKIVRGFEI